MRMQGGGHGGSICIWHINLNAAILVSRRVCSAVVEIGGWQKEWRSSGSKKGSGGCNKTKPSQLRVPVLGGPTNSHHNLHLFRSLSLCVPLIHGCMSRNSMVSVSIDDGFPLLITCTYIVEVEVVTSWGSKKKGRRGLRLRLTPCLLSFCSLVDLSALAIRSIISNHGN